MTDCLRPIIFARYPVAGACKTRLIPALGADAAAALHRRLVERTLAALAPLSPRLAYTGADAAAFRQWLGAAVPLLPQGTGDLGQRMLLCLADGPALVVGSDIPDIDAASVTDAVHMMAGSDLVIGPADDGGFWLIAARAAPPAALFAGVRWGTASVRRQVEANAVHLGLSFAHAASRADLDRPEDLARWPGIAAA